ncbi:hypothetical protein ACFW05_17015, partial [Streptomyces albogriseolus]
MTEARSPAAPSAALWERDEELAAIAEAVDVLCADRHSPGTLLVLRGEAGGGAKPPAPGTRPPPRAPPRPPGGPPRRPPDR